MTRRWNGWGDDSVGAEIPVGASALLARLVGPASPPQDATLESVVASVPPGRLPGHPNVADDPEDRLRHARGQSLGDWIALRSGRIGIVPDGVARPATSADVRELLTFAQGAGARVVPYGGGTSVVGGLSPAGLGAPQGGDPPVLSVDLERLSGLQRFDDRSGLATFGAGVPGPALEQALRGRGRLLGHEPQSWEYSTLGGWIATRSSGQRSLGFGRIEALFAGGRLEAPAGTLDLPTNPASAAGPDLRQLVLGSEGRLGIVTEATVRTVPIPEYERTVALFVPDFERALEAVRELAGLRLPLAMIRLSTPLETATTLALAGHARQVGLLMRWLRWRGVGTERSMLVFGLAGATRVAEAASGVAMKLLRGYGAVAAPPTFGRQWDRSRFTTPYLRNALWEAGYAADTLETAVDWSRAPDLAAALGRSLRTGLESEGERVHAFTHLSHVYPTGTSLYTTYLFRLAADPDVTFRRWRSLKEAASRLIVEHGGTISHQHGVGRDHAPYLPAEKGELGMAVLRDAAHRFDPVGTMDPEVLLSGGPPDRDRDA